MRPVHVAVWRITVAGVHNLNIPTFAVLFVDLPLMDPRAPPRRQAFRHFSHTNAGASSCT